MVYHSWRWRVHLLYRGVICHFCGLDRVFGVSNHQLCEMAPLSFLAVACELQTEGFRSTLLQPVSSLHGFFQISFDAQVLSFPFFQIRHRFFNHQFNKLIIFMELVRRLNDFLQTLLLLNLWYGIVRRQFMGFWSYLDCFVRFKRSLVIRSAFKSSFGFFKVLLRTSLFHSKLVLTNLINEGVKLKLQIFFVVRAVDEREVFEIF